MTPFLMDSLLGTSSFACLINNELINNQSKKNDTLPWLERQQ
jgi:hypothetical protein